MGQTKSYNPSYLMFHKLERFTGYTGNLVHFDLTDLRRRYKGVVG